ncbi:MAG: SdpI family protein [Egibacteraceae bacterium]
MWATVVAVAVAAGISIWAAPDLPARVPMHFDLSGRPDRLGSRTEALVGIPLLVFGLGVLFWVLPLVDPRQGNIARSAKAYRACMLAILAFLVGVHGLIILNGVGRPVPVVRAINGGAGLLFVVIGNYLGKTRSNWFFGVRTPWTLSSERSWGKTNRLAGRGFAMLGILVIVAALLGSPVAMLAVIFGGLTLLAVALAAYSYREWRLDEVTGKRA